MTGIQELIRHLRSTSPPYDVQGLAKEFGVDSGVIELALNQLRSETPAPVVGPATVSEWVSRINAWGAACIRILDFPLAFLFGSVGVGVALVSVLPFVVDPAVRVVLTFGFMVTIMILHQACIFRNAMGRYAAWSGIAIALGSPLMIIVQSRLSDNTRAAGSILGFGVVMGFLQVSVGLVNAFVAAYIRVRGEEAGREAMSRQDMLVRLMEVRGRLANPTTNASNEDPEWLSKLHRSVWGLALLLPLVLRIGSSPIMWAVDPTRMLVLRSQAEMPPGPIIAGMTLAVFDLAAIVGIGYLARRLRIAAGCGLAFSAVGTLTSLMPGMYFANTPRLASAPQQVAIGVALAIVFSVAGAAAYKTRYAALRKNRLAGNDRTTLLAELIDLEWRLTPRNQKVCVMAIDVVGSTAMKAGQDPLVAEMSFRDYHAWVEGIGARFGGKIHSTAGDGAVLGFEEPESALAAAAALHGAIGEFNMSKNKLSAPFSLRIGLHTGDVYGDLTEVQFTRVIDVAAHIESLAPVGGTAVSETVLAAMPEMRFRRLAGTIDGHEAHVPI